MHLSPSMHCSEPSGKIVTSSGGRAAHHFLNSADAAFLLRPLVGSALHPFVKCSGLSFGQGTPGKAVPSHCTFVFGCCLAPAPLPWVIIGGVMHLTNGCWSSTVWSHIANCS